MAADAAVSAGVVAAAALTLWLGWTWLDPVASLAIALVILVRHLGLVSRLAAPHVRRRADLDRPRSGPRRARGAARRRLRQRPARLGHRNDRGRARPRTCVMPAGHPDDAFFRAAAGAHARALRDRPRHAAGSDRDADDAVRRRRRRRRGSRRTARRRVDRRDEIQGLLRDARRAAHARPRTTSRRPTASSPASTTPTSARWPTPSRASRRSTKPTRS
mgnify:CR=1 FL=1